VADKIAEPLLLRVGDQAELERLIRADTGTAAMARRARIVLPAADGVGNQVIAERVGVSRPTVNLWRSRYAEAGMAGLVEQKRPGRPRQVDRAAILTATLRPPPKALGVTHWSSRLLAPRLGVDHATVAAVWKEYGVKPWTWSIHGGEFRAGFGGRLGRKRCSDLGEYELSKLVVVH